MSAGTNQGTTVVTPNVKMTGGSNTHNLVAETELLREIKKSEEVLAALEAEWVVSKDPTLLQYMLAKTHELNIKRTHYDNGKNSPLVKVTQGSSTHVGGVIPMKTALVPNLGPQPNRGTHVTGALSFNTPLATGSPRGTVPLSAPLSVSNLNPWTPPPPSNQAQTLGSSGGSHSLGVEKLSRLQPPEGFLGVHTDPKLQKIITSMSATKYLGKGTGLDKFMETVRNHSVGGIITPDTTRIMIYMTQNSWEKQHQKFREQLGADNCPEAFDIQGIENYRIVLGKPPFKELKSFQEFIDALKEVYINEDVVRKMIFDIRNIKQAGMDIWEYVSSYCAMATELDAIAPNRVSETEKLQNFMYGLADENIRRTINGKVDGNSGGTLTMALEAISSDIREAKRKQASAHAPRERGSSSAGPPVTYSNPQRNVNKVYSGPTHQTPYSPPSWHSEETKQLYAYRVLKGACTRCGDPKHKTTRVIGSTDPWCRVHKDDHSQKTKNHFDTGFDLNKTPKYTELLQEKRQRGEIQSVANHARLQKNGPAGSD